MNKKFETSIKKHIWRKQAFVSFVSKLLLGYSILCDFVFSVRQLACSLLYNSTFWCLYLQYGFFFLALLTRISLETADIVSKAYNKSQKDLTADSVHAPRTSCAACWKARLLEGSIYDVLTLVLKMSKPVLWCVVAEFHTISVKPWTFHHSNTILQKQKQPPQKISTFGPHLRQGAMMVCMVWWQKFVKMVYIFLYRLYCTRCIWSAISFLVCFFKCESDKEMHTVPYIL